MESKSIFMHFNCKCYMQHGKQDPKLNPSIQRMSAHKRKHSIELHHMLMQLISSASSDAEKKRNHATNLHPLRLLYSSMNLVVIYFQEKMKI